MTTSNCGRREITGFSVKPLKFKNSNLKSTTYGQNLYKKRVIYFNDLYFVSQQFLLIFLFSQ